MLSKKPVIFIKCGGSFITHKDRPYSANIENIRLFSFQMKKLIMKFPEFHYIIGNGAGSFGHYAVIKYGLTNGISRQKDVLGFVKVHNAVVRLNSLLIDDLLKNDLPVFSLQPQLYFQLQVDIWFLKLKIVFLSF